MCPSDPIPPVIEAELGIAAVVLGPGSPHPQVVEPERKRRGGTHVVVTRSGASLHLEVAVVDPQLPSGRGRRSREATPDDPISVGGESLTDLGLYLKITRKLEPGEIVYLGTVGDGGVRPKGAQPS